MTDPYSYVLAELHISGADAAEIDAKLEQARALLPFELEEIADPAQRTRN